jgi:large subunit ribosomal protein L24
MDMKPDTERRKYYKAKNHKKTKRMNLHLSKELREKLKKKTRSTLVRKGDKVRVMRGPKKGTSAKVVKVSHTKMKVQLEGVTVRTAKAREVLVPLSPSNLELIELEKTKEREVLFNEAAFSKEKKKEEKKKLDVKLEKTTIEAEVVPDEKKPEPKQAPKTVQKPAEPKPQVK